MSSIKDIKIELAKEIYKLEEENLGWKHRTSIDEFARRCINGIGRIKPMSKKDLQNRLDYLKRKEVNHEKY